MNDELRDQIKNLDPMPPQVSVTPPSRRRLEDIMAHTQAPAAPSHTRWYIGAAAAAVLALVLAVALPGLGDGPDTNLAGPPLELSLGEGGEMASCMAFDVEALRLMPIAFEGTVTGIDGEAVTLRVDQWFRGGDAATVTLSAPHGFEALIGGIDFAADGQYLITAADGAVNYCGFSGPSTPEYRSAFEEAFGS